MKRTISTEITLEADAVRVRLRGRARVGRCHECGADVEMFRVEEDADVVRSLAAAHRLHVVEGPGGTLFLCLNFPV